MITVYARSNLEAGSLFSSRLAIFNNVIVKLADERCSSNLRPIENPADGSSISARGLVLLTNLAMALK
ncbi:MAG: hypothetical protein ACKPKO_06095, partial [Candidatus Fonsibacter sp.]